MLERHEGLGRQAAAIPWWGPVGGGAAAGAAVGGIPGALIGACIGALFIPGDTPQPDCRKVKDYCVREHCADQLREDADLGGNWGFWRCINKCMADRGC
jgi:hypothetical protein